MPLTLTTVPAVLAALIDLGASVLPAGVVTIDGTPDTDNLPTEFLAVGVSRDEDEPGVDGALSDEGNGTASETYTVRCVLSTATGDTGTQAVRDRRTRTAALFSTYAGAVRADPYLGGVLVAGGRADIETYA